MVHTIRADATIPDVALFLEIGSRWRDDDVAKSMAAASNRRIVSIFWRNGVRDALQNRALGLGFSPILAVVPWVEYFWRPFMSAFAHPGSAAWGVWRLFAGPKRTPDALCGQQQRPNLFQDFSKFGLRGEAHGSISVQEGQPHSSLILPRIFSFRSRRVPRIRQLVKSEAALVVPVLCDPAERLPGLGGKCSAQACDEKKHRCPRPKLYLFMW
jgi:hypothetical protein